MKNTREEELFAKELRDREFVYLCCEKPRNTILIDKGVQTHQYLVNNKYYTPDFIIFYGDLLPNGKVITNKIYIEVKGGNPKFINNKRDTYRSFKKYLHYENKKSLYYVVRYHPKRDKWYLQSQNVPKKISPKSKIEDFWSVLRRGLKQYN